MHFPFVIVGGGIIGLMIAREIKKSHPKHEVILFEENPFLGEHSTFRNSGVLHAGLYYPKNSLKHRLCLEGNSLWREYYSDFVNKCGKYLISTDSSEDEQLDQLYLHATDNGVPALRHCDEKEIQNLRPFVNVSKAFFSETTSVIDISNAMKFLERELESLGVHILKSQKVLEVKFDKVFHLKTTLESISCDFFINAAGLGSIDLREQLGLRDFSRKLVKGNYLKLNKLFFNESLLYPVPPKSLKGLGVHTSFSTDGAIRFGPNTEDIQDIDYSLNEEVVSRMYPEIKKIFKGINKSDLSIDYSGIRSKIEGDSIIYSDFYIESGKSYGLSKYIECLGIESPGLSAAPAIAKRVNSIVESLI